MFICIVWLASISCTDAVVFERDNPNDPGNPDYVPMAPISVSLYRNGRHLEMSWYMHEGGVDRITFEKSTDGTTFTPFGVASPTDPSFRDTTSVIAYPMTYRVRTVFDHPDGERISAPFDIALPEPIPQVEPGTEVGSFTISERLIIGQIPNYRTLYGFAIRFTDVVTGTSEVVQNPAPAYLSYPGSSTDVIQIYHNILFTTPCPYTVTAVLEVYLPLKNGNLKIAEYPLRGSPYTIRCWL